MPKSCGFQHRRPSISGRAPSPARGGLRRGTPDQAAIGGPRSAAASRGGTAATAARAQLASSADLSLARAARTAGGLRPGRGARRRAARRSWGPRRRGSRAERRGGARRTCRLQVLVALVPGVPGPVLRQRPRLEPEMLAPDGAQRVALVDVVAEVDDEIQILLRHVFVGRVGAGLVVLARRERMQRAERGRIGERGLVCAGDTTWSSKSLALCCGAACPGSGRLL